ncbi:antitoxin MazE-like protein [Rhizobium laguerreae]|uniref:antitoxin MazE-like protein n=1 Tax=Rhizobium laguerreae TaxID=1076926 RepID=UPI0035E43F20
MISRVAQNNIDAVLVQRSRKSQQERGLRARSFWVDDSREGYHRKEQRRCNTLQPHRSRPSADLHPLRIA